MVPLFGWSLPVWAIEGCTSPHPPPPPTILRLEQIEFWSLLGLHYLLIRSYLFCLFLLPVPDRVVPLRMCWTYRRSKGKMVLSSVSKPDETTEKRGTT